MGGEFTTGELSAGRVCRGVLWRGVRERLRRRRERAEGCEVLAGDQAVGGGDGGWGVGCTDELGQAEGVLKEEGLGVVGREAPEEGFSCSAEVVADEGGACGEAGLAVRVKLHEGEDGVAGVGGDEREEMGDGGWWQVHENTLGDDEGGTGRERGEDVGYLGGFGEVAGEEGEGGWRECGENFAFFLLRVGVVDLEALQVWADRSQAVGEAVETGTEDDEIGDGRVDGKIEDCAFSSGVVGADAGKHDAFGAPDERAVGAGLKMGDTAGGGAAEGEKGGFGEGGEVGWNAVGRGGIAGGEVDAGENGGSGGAGPVGGLGGGGGGGGGGGDHGTMG